MIWHLHWSLSVWVAHMPSSSLKILKISTAKPGLFEQDFFLYRDYGTNFIGYHRMMVKSCARQAGFWLLARSQYFFIAMLILCLCKMIFYFLPPYITIKPPFGFFSKHLPRKSKWCTSAFSTVPGAAIKGNRPQVASSQGFFLKSIAGKSLFKGYNKPLLGYIGDEKLPAYIGILINHD